MCGVGGGAVDVSASSTIGVTRIHILCLQPKRIRKPIMLIGKQIKNLQNFQYETGEGHWCYCLWTKWIKVNCLHRSPSDLTLQRRVTLSDICFDYLQTLLENRVSEQTNKKQLDKQTSQLNVAKQMVSLASNEFVIMGLVNLSLTHTR